MVTSKFSLPSPVFFCFKIIEDPASYCPGDFPLTVSLSWVGSCVYVYIHVAKFLPQRVPYNETF